MPIMQLIKTPNERELLLLLKESNEHAFFELYQLYKDAIGLKLLRLLRNDALAEEILQDVFMKVWENRSKIDPDLSFKAYLYRIAQNLAIDVLRRASKEKHIFDQISHASTELYSHIEEHIFKQENEALLYRVVDKLPPQRKRIFIMFKIEGKSYKEISEELGIAPSTIAEHIYKATAFLKEYLTTPSGLQLAIIIYLALDQ